MKTGDEFSCGGFDWVISSIEAIDQNMKKTIEAMVNSGKEPVRYFASKKLKSGKQSKQGGLFFMFKESQKFIKVL